jgi:hypothetical protein
MVSPVRGLRPVRAARLPTANVPKPTSDTVPPLFEGFLHSLNRGVQCASSRSLGDVGVVGDVLNQFGFIHKMPLEK